MLQVPFRQDIEPESLEKVSMMLTQPKDTSDFKCMPGAKCTSIRPRDCKQVLVNAQNFQAAADSLLVIPSFQSCTSIER